MKQTQPSGRNRYVYSDSSMGPKTKKKKKNKFFVTFICFFLIFAACFTIGGTIWYLQQDNDIWVPGDTTDPGNTVTPKSRKDKVEYFLFAGIDDAADLADVIIVMCYDKINNTANFLQIPRDTYVGEDIPSGKINAIHNHPNKGEKGIESLAKFINSQFLLPIDHYVTFTVKGFRNVVDAVGGVDITNPKQINFGAGKVLPKGRVHLNGTKAEWFVRERRSRSGGDIGRIEAQQRFLAAFAQKIKNTSFSDLSSNVLPKAYKHVKTDMSIGEIIEYVRIAQNIPMENIKIFIMPGTQKTTTLSYYSINKYDAVWLLQEYFNPHNTEPITIDKFYPSMKNELVPSQPSAIEDRPKPVPFSIFD